MLFRHQQLLTGVLCMFALGHALAYEFEVKCDQEMANESRHAAHYQNYVGPWIGEWKRDEHISVYPESVKERVELFDYDVTFRVDVLRVEGCDVEFRVYYRHDSDYFVTYNEEVMTFEGIYVYWNSPTIDGTYILDYDKEQDILDGVFQVFTGQNIAKIEMRRR